MLAGDVRRLFTNGVSVVTGILNMITRIHPCWTQPSASNMFLLYCYPQSFSNVMLTVKLAFLGDPQAGNTYDPICPENGTTRGTMFPSYPGSG